MLKNVLVVLLPHALLEYYTKLWQYIFTHTVLDQFD